MLTFAVETQSGYLCRKTNSMWESVAQQCASIMHPTLADASFIIYYSLFIIHHSLFNIHDSSFVIHHPLCISHYSRFTMHYSRFIIYHSSLTLRRQHSLFMRVMWLQTHHSSFTVHISSFITHYSLFTIHHSLFIIHYSRFSTVPKHHHLRCFEGCLLREAHYLPGLCDFWGRRLSGLWQPTAAYGTAVAPFKTIKMLGS